jgi:protein tyrosine/serine phosphatase
MILNSYINNMFHTNVLKVDKTSFKQIYNFKRVDDFLYRGSLPKRGDIKKLKNMGIDTVIDFTIGGNHKTRDLAEKNAVEKLGMNYIRLPFAPYKNPPQEYIDTFFKTMDNARKNNEKVYIHCHEGKDRTGLFSAIYEITYNNANWAGCIQEMIEMGHNYICFPNIIKYLKDFYYNI